MNGHTDPTRAVVEAARDLAARYQITPRWQERLTPEARRLVEAVIEHERAAAGVTS